LHRPALPASAFRPPAEPRASLEGWPRSAIRLPRGTARRLIDEDRGEG
jgi:hypothetical protein